MQQLFARSLSHLPPLHKGDLMTSDPYMEGNPFSSNHGPSYPLLPLALIGGLDRLDGGMQHHHDRERERDGGMRGGGDGGMRGGGDGGMESGMYLGPGSSQEGLSPCHLKKAKLMFFYARYPSSNTLKTFFPDVKFNRCVTSQLIKWFSNFREFFYIQMERFARQAARDSQPRDSASCLGRDSRGVPLRLGRDTELYRILNMHYNKSNDYQVPEKFMEVAELALREFYTAIQTGRDSDPCWKKSIYKIIFCISVVSCVGSLRPLPSPSHREQLCLTMTLVVSGIFLFFLLVTGCILTIGRNSLCESVTNSVPGITSCKEAQSKNWLKPYIGTQFYTGLDTAGTAVWVNFFLWIVIDILVVIQRTRESISMGNFSGPSLCYFVSAISVCVAVFCFSTTLYWIYMCCLEGAVTREQLCLTMTLVVSGIFLFFLLVTGCILTIGRNSLCDSVTKSVPGITSCKEAQSKNWLKPYIGTQFYTGLGTAGTAVWVNFFFWIVIGILVVIQRTRGSEHSLLGADPSVMPSETEPILHRPAGPQ
ncbi:hypothetical protein DPEC_G00105370 [Dallia pectoralis]|uniref:Uncharacterized protein n=1 Tax=Dallia pectoralis TaxID=75939 RepID=A0ACC2GYN8_DALPE|nr:hypothetical protein DPEC_G00105370 [Dallia pectoralis]